MATSTFSNSILLQLFLLPIISLFLINNRNIVVADHDLMKSLCESTEVPALCMRCLESDPKSGKADEIGIATIVVNCLSDNSRTALSNLTEVLKSVTDEKMKAAVTKCTGEYPKVIDLVSAGNIHLKKGEYDAATDALSSAIENEQICFDEIEPFKEHFENIWVFYGLRVFEELSEAAMRIVDRIV